MRAFISKMGTILILSLVSQGELFAQKVQFGFQIGSGISFTRPDSLTLDKDGTQVKFSSPTSLKVGLTAKLPFQKWLLEFDGDICWNPIRKIRFPKPFPLFPPLPPFPFPIPDPTPWPPNCPVCGIDLILSKEILVSVLVGRQLTERWSMAAGISQWIPVARPEGNDVPAFETSTVYQLKTGYDLTRHWGVYADYSDLLKPNSAKSEQKMGFRNGAKRLNVGLNVRF